MNTEIGQGNIRVLGPFHVCLLETNVTPTAAKQRQILALLALNSGRVVTVPALVEELWGCAPPRSSVTTLQTYIRQLRCRFASALPKSQDAYTAISTCHGGYMLQNEWFHTDVVEFERAAREGRVIAERGDLKEASATLSEALELWQGSVLPDVPVGQVMELKTRSLEEMHLSVLTRRIELDLALERHSDVLGELRVLIAKHAMNENFSGLLMIALYRSGHAAGALEEFRRIRAVLRSELGIDPSPRLQRLQRLILERDPALEDTSSVAYTGGRSC